MFSDNDHIVMTLDAGGTNLVFSAIQAGREIVPPVRIDSNPSELTACLANIKKGFDIIKSELSRPPAAISFAFPGPADYPAGIIGDLPNLPCFRGGVALGPYLENAFGIPVFINNDGDLFAYGEAHSGALPEINKRLEAAGSIKRYKNLLGVTIGTGFGCGVVLDGKLLQGDNACGGDIWCFRNKKYPQYIVEDSVSIRAVKRVYTELSGDASERSPKDIFDIAEGTIPGDRQAAMASFAELGEIAGDAVASAITIVDGIIVVGGGLAGASKYIFPTMTAELNGNISMMNGASFGRLQAKVFNLEDDRQFEEFAKGRPVKIPVPGTDKLVDYDPVRRIGVVATRQGTSRSVSLGAYMYALNQLQNIPQ